MTHKQSAIFLLITQAFAILALAGAILLVFCGCQPVTLGIPSDMPKSGCPEVFPGDGSTESGSPPSGWCRITDLDPDANCRPNGGGYGYWGRWLLPPQRPGRFGILPDPNEYK